MIDLHTITPLALDANFHQDGVFIPFNKEILVMQSTGLVDKNGNVIFEGDILAAKFWPEWVERVSWRGKPDVVSKVIWDFCGFRLEAFGAEDHRYPSFGDINRKESEVIGNIYENPELIK